ncbi:MAG: metal-dependent transcriptional regulator [Clostridia bacterium]|nr:metal-dependent transcriptional regulator [Clostridia bacterium]
MKIQESAENYLETILMLKEKRGAVRSIDVANELGFSKPSVSVAMKHLRESGHVTVDEGGFISLTEKGNAIASAIYERHCVIAELLMRIGVSEETAFEDACKVEHKISEETFDRMRECYKKIAKKDG